jgi:hypothetical protein
VTLTPAAVAVSAGGTSTTTLNIARTNFTGNVTLTAENLPSGVTATFNPNPPTGTTTTLTLNAVTGATQGTSNIIIRAAGVGVPDATSTLALRVAPPAGTSGSTLTLAPAALTIAQGANGTTTVNIARTNFTGAQTLTAENLPAGVTAAFATSPTTGNNAVLTLTANGTATVGTSNITIRGTGAGVGDASVTLPLTITAAAGGNYSLTATPAAVTVVRGGAAVATTITLNRTGGFTGNVDFVVVGTPPGVTATFTPTNTTGNTVTLTITASAGATVGNGTLTITGSSTGLGNQVVTVPITVN